MVVHLFGFFFLQIQPRKPTMVGGAESFQFRTETREILDIVAQSLYTDKGVCHNLPLQWLHIQNKPSDIGAVLHHTGCDGGCCVKCGDPHHLQWAVAGVHPGADLQRCGRHGAAAVPLVGQCC